MNTERTSRGNNRGRIPILFAVVGLLSLIILSASCRDEPMVEDTNDYLELIRYIENSEEGRALFRTEGLILDQPYTKPNRPGGVEFRDSLESVTRNFSGEIPGGFVEKNFGPPFGIVDDAYFVVQDEFRIHILADSAGSQWLDQIQDRTLYRRAYFLRLGSERGAYRGWLMHGYNGGTPRGMAGMELKRSNGSTFLGDGLDYNYIRYDRIVTKYWPDPYPPFDSITVDTFFRDQTNDPYILLSEIARVTKGDELSISSFDNSTANNAPGRSIYQLMSSKTDSGPVYRTMHGPDSGRYADTIRTPSTTNDIWDIIFFQEFQFVDRPGGMWCVPYRVR